LSGSEAFHLFCYDIVDDRRREKVAKLMEAHGARVQKSVFECVLEPDRLERLIARALKLIDKKTDSLRVYRLCGACLRQVRRLGRDEAQHASGAMVA